MKFFWISPYIIYHGKTVALFHDCFMSPQAVMCSKCRSTNQIANKLKIIIIILFPSDCPRSG